MTWPDEVEDNKFENDDFTYGTKNYVGKTF